MKIVLGIAVFVLVMFFILSFAFLSAEEFGDLVAVAMREGWKDE
jgi:hypothetical protein